MNARKPELPSARAPERSNPRARARFFESIKFIEARAASKANRESFVAEARALKKSSARENRRENSAYARAREDRSRCIDN